MRTCINGNQKEPTMYSKELQTKIGLTLKGVPINLVGTEEFNKWKTQNTGRTKIHKNPSRQTMWLRRKPVSKEKDKQIYWSEDHTKQPRFKTTKVPKSTKN